MKQIDLYKDKIVQYLKNEKQENNLECSIKEAVEGKGACDKCKSEDCANCCLKTFLWLLEDVKEKYILSKLEYELLQFAFNKGMHYIVRTLDIKHSNIIFSSTKPEIKLRDFPLTWSSTQTWDVNEGFTYTLDIILSDNNFKFVNSKEPIAIEDILNNYVIIEESNNG